MKKIMVIILLLTVMLTGCSGGKKRTSVVWYVENGTFDMLSNEDLYRPVVNDKTKAVANLLEKQNATYEIIFKCYGKDLRPESLHFLDTLKKKDSEFDIVTFNPLEYTNYMSLDSSLNKKEYEKLQQIIPKNAWLSQQINGHQYQIPKPSIYYLQPSYSMSKEYIKKHQITESFFQQAYSTVMKQMMDTVEKDEDLNKKFNFSSSEIILLRELNHATYKSITDMTHHFFEGIVIRKQDHKVMNVYEIDEVKEQMTMNQKIYAKNLDGHKENLNLPFVLGFSYTFPKEYQTAENLQMEFPIDSPYAALSIGYGIMKDSEQKVEALQALQFIYTNKDASNLLIYGIKGKDYTVKDGKAITTKKNTKMVPFGTFAKLGNNLIAYPSEVEPLNKKAIADNYNQQLPQDRMDTFIPDIQKFEKKYCELHDIYMEVTSTINYHEINDMNAYYAQVNERLYAAGLQEVIVELQKQVDAFVGDRQ